MSVPLARTPRPLRTAAALALLAPMTVPLAQPGFRGGTTIKPGEACPAGMTEIRPRICQAPQSPAPSIVDYRPKSTLKVPETMRRRAKFPVIDFHGHPTNAQLGSAEALERFGPTLDSINVRLMIAANNTSGDALAKGVALVKASPTMKERVRFLTGISFAGVGTPGWAAKAVHWKATHPYKD